MSARTLLIHSCIGLEHKRFVMAGLDPATQPPSVREANGITAPAYADAMGGRLKGGHDGMIAYSETVRFDVEGDYL